MWIGAGEGEMAKVGAGSRASHVPMKEQTAHENRATGVIERGDWQVGWCARSEIQRSICSSLWRAGKKGFRRGVRGGAAPNA